MPRGLPRRAKESVCKAREAALLAVEVYNKPAVTFRTGGFISLIVIAWTALFHAIFFRRGVKPYYRKKNSSRYVRIGKDQKDYKHWELSECLLRYYGDNNTPERMNLELIREVRDKIEHRSMPEIDTDVFGECQACILNFEELLIEEFGEKYSINSYLTFPLQISRKFPEQPLKLSADSKGVLAFVKEYRSALSADIYGDQKYSFKVYLVPKVGNRLTRDTAAVEFIHYDPTKSKEMEEYEKVVAFIKERHVPVINLDYLKATQVKEQVQQAGVPDFSMNKHTWSWRYYGVRPSWHDPYPAQCKTEYCIYDNVHHDYVYTEKWVEFLIEKWSDPEERERILRDPKCRVARRAQ